MSSNNQLSQYLGKKVIVGKAERSDRHFNRGGYMCPQQGNFELTSGRHVSAPFPYSRGADLDYASGCTSNVALMDTLTSLRPYVRDRFAYTGVDHADTLDNSNPGRTFYTCGSSALSAPTDSGNRNGSLDLTPEAIYNHNVITDAYQSPNGQEPLQGGCALRQYEVTPNKRRQALNQLYRQRQMNGRARQANNIEGFTTWNEYPQYKTGCANCNQISNNNFYSNQQSYGNGLISISAQNAKQLQYLTEEQAIAALNDPNVPLRVKKAIEQAYRSWKNKNHHSRRRTSRDAYAAVSGYPNYYM